MSCTEALNSGRILLLCLPLMFLYTNCRHRCGVFAYVNHGVVRPQHYIVDALITGLRRLEYRGYDSAGIAIDDVTHFPDGGSGRQAENGNGHHDGPASVVIKETGKIDCLAKLVEEKTAQLGFDLHKKVANHAGIAHTRWVSSVCPPWHFEYPPLSNPRFGDARRTLEVVLVTLKSIPCHSLCCAGDARPACCEEQPSAHERLDERVPRCPQRNHHQLRRPPHVPLPPRLRLRERN